MNSSTENIKKLKVGLKVYHKKINQNLIVVNISNNGIRCIDSKDTGENCFSTMIIDACDLEIGWKSPTELRMDRMKRMVKR